MRAHFFRLLPFAVTDAPTAASNPVVDVEITGTLTLESGTVNVNYCIRGATERVKFASPSAPPARKNELWRTTCFELFVKLPVGSEYWEYNLAPSGDWNVYRFASYRSALSQDAQIADLAIACEVGQAGLTSLSATLPLPSRLVNQKLAIGISSVIEDRAGKLFYFALRHGGSKPDFHDPAGFDISLDPATE